jgi:hypothetical protein
LTVTSGSLDTVKTIVAVSLAGFGSGVLLDAVAENVMVPAVAGATNETFPVRLWPGGMSPSLQLQVFGVAEEIDTVTAGARSGPLFLTMKTNVGVEPERIVDVGGAIVVARSAEAKRERDERRSAAVMASDFMTES